MTDKNAETLRQILASVANGQTTVENALIQLNTAAACDNIGFAHVDLQRRQRQGFPEVIFGAGKTPEQICAIMERLCQQENVVLVTRIDPAAAALVQQKFPGAAYHDQAAMIVHRQAPSPVTGRGRIAVFSAGTSDIPVAEEARLTAEAMGNIVETVFDVGVAGLHRLFNYLELIQNAAVLVVVAGMEGALPSVIGGLTSRPVIAVPTSIGYGANLGGLTALFGMLNSCSSNVATVNIDNGFGAGYMAACINREQVCDRD